MWKFVSVPLIALCSIPTVSADGLVFMLPEDRTAAVYQMELTIEQNGKKAVQKGTVLIGSVGQLEIAGVKLRWLEIMLNFSEGEDKYRMIYKVLVPEKFLREAGSPAECILKCWHTRKIRPADEGKQINVEILDKHPHDERWTYLPTFILTGAMSEKKRLAPIQLDTILGKDQFGGVSGKFDYEQETRKWQAKVETRLHQKAPFGVVSSRSEFTMERNGKTFTGEAAFKLIEVMRNYAGELNKYQ